MMKRIVDIAKRHYYLLAGILMYLSFPSYDVWFLKGFFIVAWGSLAPLFMYVRNRPLAEVYRASFVTGLVGIFLVYDWIGEFGYKIPNGNVIILLLIIPTLAVFFATKIAAAEFLSRRFERLRVLIYPAVWIAIDGVQGIGFLAFPWTYWGYSQYPFTSFVQIASLTGIFGISFIVICANSCIAEAAALISKKGLSLRPFLGSMQFKQLAALFSLVAVCALYGAAMLYTRTPGKDKTMRIAMVQTCIDPWENWSINRYDNLATLVRLTKKALEKKPDLIIWSESATLELISFDYERNRLNPFEEEVLKIARENETPLLTGEVGIKTDFIKRRIDPQNNAVLIDERGEVSNTYSKIHLVPFGEWFPYEKWVPFVKEITSQFGGSDFVPGDEPSLFRVRGVPFGALICYEGIFQRLCRNYRNMGAELFINITNLLWTKTYRGHMQGFWAAKFRAIENGIWFVSAGNSGYTALVDPHGRVTASIPILRVDYLVGEIDLSMNRRTVYSAVGDIVLYASLCLLFVLSCVIFYRRITAGRTR